MFSRGLFRSAIWFLFCSIDSLRTCLGTRLCFLEPFGGDPGRACHPQACVPAVTIHVSWPALALFCSIAHLPPSLRIDYPSQPSCEVAPYGSNLGWLRSKSGSNICISRFIILSSRSKLPWCPFSSVMRLPGLSS